MIKEFYRGNDDAAAAARAHRGTKPILTSPEGRSDRGPIDKADGDGNGDGKMHQIIEARSSVCSAMPSKAVNTRHQVDRCA